MNRKKVSRIIMVALGASAIGLMPLSAAYAATPAGPGSINAAGVATGGWVAGNPFEVNISGATLFYQFFQAPAGNNDFTDVDGNGFTGFSAVTPPFVQDLAPSPTFTNGTGAVNYGFSGTYPTVLAVNYRGVGSGNGITELAAYVSAGTLPSSIPSEHGYYNNLTYASFGASVPVTNANQALNTGQPVTQNSVDIGVTDVPFSFVMQGSSTANDFADASWSKKPNAVGYGVDPMGQTAVTPSGQAIPANPHQTLKAQSILSTGMKVSESDASTISPITMGNAGGTLVSESQVAISSIALVANPGTGKTQLTDTQAQYLFATSRMPTGEHLMVATRDTGSGTRVGAMTSLGIDPAWARGSYIGPKILAQSATLAGASHEICNMGSNDLQGQSMNNSRLAVGYLGMDVYAGTPAYTSGLECLALAKDNTHFVRPTVDTANPNDQAGNNIFYNSNVTTGWQVGGIETFATVGDPNATYAASPTLAGQPSLAAFAGNANTPMANAAAAAYVRNITSSIAAYVSANGLSNSTTQFSPGQYLANNYLLVAAADAVPSLADPTVWIANPAENDQVKAASITDHAWTIPASGSEGAGFVPQRTANPAVAYSDAALVTPHDASGASYIDQNGTLYLGNAALALPVRNTIAGDFNGTGVRNINQVPQMMQAYASRNGGAAWVAPDGVWGAGSGRTAIIEVLGDFNGTGTFDANQVRWFADGLALRTTTVTDQFGTTHTAGNLDRKAGFQAVDANWTAANAGAAISAAHPAGNFFNTTINLGSTATVVPYIPGSGASRADICPTGTTFAFTGANPTVVTITATTATPGFKPAAKGSVNMSDINYIKANYGTWSNLNSASTIDLSADVNGDGVVDNKDVYDVARNVMRAWAGDFNLDGSVDASDYTIFALNFGKTWTANKVTFLDGDANGDGTIDASDYTAFALNFGKTGYDTTLTAGSLGITGLGDSSGGQGTFSGGPATLTPEPSSLILLGLGAGLVLRRRRNT